MADPEHTAGLALEDINDSCLVEEEINILSEIDYNIGEEESFDKEEHCSVKEYIGNDDKK